MKTGILTFHRAHNYGAALQCYALLKVLEKKGHDVEVIDYRQPYIEFLYSLKSLRNADSFVNKLRRVKRSLMGKYIFGSFRRKHLKTGKPFKGNSIPAYEHYVIGSDQVWSSDCTSGFDLTYFGEFRRNEDSMLTGYAVSTTVKSISGMDSGQLRRYIEGFDRISFREKKITEIAEAASGREFPVTLDPTLLLDADEWREVSGDKPEGDVVLYILTRDSYPGLLDKMREKSRELARRLGCGVTEIKQGQIGVESFVREFASAKAVVTNSFHGTAFSVIFRRPLYAVSLGDTLDDRYVGLLKEIEADSHIVNPDFDTSDIKDRLIFNEEHFERIRKESIAFLPDSV